MKKILFSLCISISFSNMYAIDENDLRYFAIEGAKLIGKTVLNVVLVDLTRTGKNLLVGYFSNSSSKPKDELTKIQLIATKMRLFEEVTHQKIKATEDPAQKERLRKELDSLYDAVRASQKEEILVLIQSLPAQADSHTLGQES